MKSVLAMASAVVLVLVAVPMAAVPAMAADPQATGAVQVVADASGKLAFDPQSLVGEWEGEWNTKGTVNRRYSNGRLYLTISSVVNGDKVVGKYEITPASGPWFEGITGTLNGSKLTIMSPYRQFYINIDGTTMTGEATGTVKDFAFSLKKK